MVTGYLIGEKKELRMPKGPNRLGITFQGEALTGEKSVEHRRADDAVPVSPATEETYRKVADYDPVLRSHCRL